jgi:hypothetical protein
MRKHGIKRFVWCGGGNTAGDCAAEMIRMLSDDTWLYKAPVIQY